MPEMKKPPGDYFPWRLFRVEAFDIVKSRSRIYPTSTMKREKTVLGRPGSDILSQALRLSTICAEKINGRVRNGIGFEPLAKTTRPAENSFLKQASFVLLGVVGVVLSFLSKKSSAIASDGHR